MIFKNNPLRQFFIYTLLFFLSSLTLSAQQFELNTNCRQAYNALMDLRLEEARLALEAEQSENPNNYLRLLFENYLEMLVVYFEEQSEDLEIYDKNKDKRLDLIKQGDKDSPYYLYAQAEIKLQSTLARMKFEQYFTAAREIRRAHIMLKENQEKFPDFIPNQKSLSYIKVIIGTVPDSYKWVLKILGFKGELVEGMQDLKTYIQDAKENAYPFYREAQLVYTFFLIFFDTQYDKALQIINNDFHLKNSKLDNYIAANICGRIGKIEEGINFLSNSFSPTQYYHPLIIDYMQGTLKLYRMDSDANQYLEYFVNNFKGKHYIKDAYQKIAWHYRLNNNDEQYEYHIQQCLSKGATLVDNDNRALEEAKQGIPPQTELLKARLLFDGGYYEKSLNVLTQLNPNDLYERNEQIEFTYRLGRNYEGLGQDENALSFYQNTIEISEGISLYFAPKAALQSGIIYEKTGDYAQAKSFYKKALQYRNHAYKNTIDQQAKAGLNRLKNR